LYAIIFGNTASARFTVEATARLVTLKISSLTGAMAPPGAWLA
jgi:hypothetical protein